MDTPFWSCHAELGKAGFWAGQSVSLTLAEEYAVFVLFPLSSCVRKERYGQDVCPWFKLSRLMITSGRRFRRSGSPRGFPSIASFPSDRANGRIPYALRQPILAETERIATSKP